MTKAQPIFVLDANVFIQAHRRHYGLDLCPGFWDSLLHHQASDRLVSIDRVRKEIEEGDKDALEAWVKDKSPEAFWASTAEPQIAQHFGGMMQWVQAQAQFKPEAKALFAQKVDGWLVAYAKAHGGIVVTHEEYSADAKKRVPIPNVCKQVGVLSIDTFAMLKNLKVRFHWKGP